VSSPRVLIVATTTGYQVRSFGAAAEAIGARLVFATDRCDHLDDPWQDEAVPIRFHDHPAAVDAVARAFGDRPPDAVVAVGDRPSVLAARLTERFGLPGNPPAAAEASRDKHAARAAFHRAGLPVPSFVELALDGDPGTIAAALRYPAVVKPLGLSASRGVMRVDTAAQFAAAFARLRTLLRSADVRSERDALHERVLVETFIPGREYAVEGVLTRGAFRCFAIFDKPDPLDGPFFEETIYVTPSRAAVATQRQIVDAIGAAARALGLHHGPVHAECRVNASGVYVLEVAARPIGGLCSRALRFVGDPASACRTRRIDADNGERDRQTAPIGAPPVSDRVVSLEEVLLRHALGEDVACYAREDRASGVMMVPIPLRGRYRRVDGLEAARATEGVDDVVVTAKPGAVVVPLPEGRSYLGFIFAHAAAPAGAEAALRAAHARLRFHIDREVPMRAR
jgi:hypothetical protein